MVGYVSRSKEQPRLPTREEREDSVLRFDVSPEDLLDQEAFEEVERKFEESEVRFQRCLDDGTIEERLLTIEDLKELAERVRQGEQVSLKKT